MNMFRNKLQNVLPRILSGSSAGSLVASLICTTRDDKLHELFNGDRPFLTNTYLVSRPGEVFTFWDRVRHFIESGVLADVNVLKECIRDNIGEITFQVVSFCPFGLFSTVNRRHTITPAAF